MAITKVSFNERLKILLVLALIAGGIIALRLVDIQVLRHPNYMQLAERNRTQILYQTAPRGRIFTSDGVAIASNAPAFSLYYLGVSQQDPVYIEQLATDIAPYLKIPPEKVRARLEESGKTGKAVGIASNLSTKRPPALQEVQP